MRYFFTFTILLFCQINSYCQKDSQKTEVIIIGTIHTGNKYFNHKTLYKLLDSLKPDIILNEASEKFKLVFALKTATFLKYLRPSIEQLALQTFSKRNSKTIILPYDTIFDRKEYIKNLKVLDAAIFDNLQLVTKGYLDSLNLANDVSNRRNYYSLFREKNLEEINEPKFYTIAREFYRNDKELIMPLIKKYLIDTILIKKFEDDLIFWNVRNNYMVRQIENISKEYPNKRIIVLTGINHKYFLTDRLLNTKIKNLNLTELSVR